MDVIADAGWRLYPAGLVIGVGAVMVFWGVRRLVQMERVPSRDRTKPIQYAGGLRLMFAGFAVVGVGAAWVWNQPFILAVALGIGGVELVETTVVLLVLRSRERRFQKES